jgi:lipopolysaccharide export LptBFGC system permease protein LptF
VLFLLLGVPTGLLLRRGTQLGALAVAVGYALVYYILSMRFGRHLVANHVLPPVLGAWIVIVAGSLVGLVLMRKAIRE